MTRSISPRKIYDRISQKVVGQEEAKRIISITVFLHFVRYGQHVLDPSKEIKKSNALLMGPTGCGKTFIVREAVKAIQELSQMDICPLLEIDCTEVTPAGYVGETLSELICEHYKEHGRNNEACFNSSIVFLDEFDKICKAAPTSKGEDFNKATQYNLLKIIEGTNIPEVEGRSHTGRALSTHQMLFILAGNFSEVRHNRKNKSKSIGMVKLEDKNEYFDLFTELEDAGMASQLVGRVPHVAELKELQPHELYDVLDNFLIPSYQETWKYLGKKLRVPEASKRKMSQDCHKRKTGARGLQADLAQYVEHELFDTEFNI